MSISEFSSTPKDHRRFPGILFSHTDLESYIRFELFFSSLVGALPLPIIIVLCCHKRLLLFGQVLNEKGKLLCHC
jgi:hypothetical protein